MDREGAASGIDLVTGRESTVRALSPHGIDGLSFEEKQLVNALVNRIIKFVNELNMLTKPIARAAAGRLIEKLRLASLPEGSVGTIAQVVWGKLKNASEVPGDSCSPAELQIVEDIMRRLDGNMGRLIGSREKAISSLDPAMNGKVIRAAAVIAWPQVKVKLGV